EPDLGLIEPGVVLAELEALFDWPSEPGRGDQAFEGDGLAGGNVAVVMGALAGGQVTADQQPVPRAGGGDPRPRVSPLALGTGPGGDGLPVPAGPQMGGDHFR